MDFGDYALIEQKRYGCKNEMFLYKVIGIHQSNAYVDVPVQSPATEILHDEIVDIVSCICCGVQELEVLKYKASDVKPTDNQAVHQTRHKDAEQVTLSLGQKILKA